MKWINQPQWPFCAEKCQKLKKNCWITVIEKAKQSESKPSTILIFIFFSTFSTLNMVSQSIFYLLINYNSFIFLKHPGPYERAYIAATQHLLRLPQCTSPRNAWQTTFPLVHWGSCIAAANKGSRGLWQLVDCGSRKPWYAVAAACRGGWILACRSAAIGALLSLPRNSFILLSVNHELEPMKNILTMICWLAVLILFKLHFLSSI